ncbi:MAG: DUF5615 family PIN-like protein [Saprospiraceae bacterium]|nr:DUF5615 family PIN-like protein [Saprospiraceae bacterium]
MARIYANENFYYAVVEILQQLGHDVLTTKAAGNANKAIPDEEVLNFAESKAEIYINTLDVDGKELETLGFFKIPLKSGRYYLTYGFNQPPDDSLTGCFYANGYEDQLYDSYLLSPEDSTSYLEITEYDNKKQEIKGKFNLIVWPDIKGSWNAPDSIVFSGGEFHTKIDD